MTPLFFVALSIATARPTSAPSRSGPPTRSGAPTHSAPPTRPGPPTHSAPPTRSGAPTHSAPPTHPAPPTHSGPTRQPSPAPTPFEFKECGGESLAHVNEITVEPELKAGHKAVMTIDSKLEQDIEGGMVNLTLNFHNVKFAGGFDLCMHNPNFTLPNRTGTWNFGTVKCPVAASDNFTIKSYLTLEVDGPGNGTFRAFDKDHKHLLCFYFRFKVAPKAIALAPTAHAPSAHAPTAHAPSAHSPTAHAPTQHGPSAAPGKAPSAAPGKAPSAAPGKAPTQAPGGKPTAAPSSTKPFFEWKDCSSKSPAHVANVSVRPSYFKTSEHVNVTFMINSTKEVNDISLNVTLDIESTKISHHVDSLKNKTTIEFDNGLGNWTFYYLRFPVHEGVWNLPSLLTFNHAGAPSGTVQAFDEEGGKFWCAHFKAVVTPRF